MTKYNEKASLSNCKRKETGLNLANTSNLSFITLVILMVFSSNKIYAQSGNIPIGTWRYHTSYNNATTVAQAGSKVYCGTEGGLFYFDKEENSVNKLQKLDGLNDLEVNVLYYHQPTKALIIGYKSGNIDVVRNNTIYNIPYILNANNITGSKNINAISGYKNIALIACDFGVVLLNIPKLEIQESWLNIGEGGSAIVANDIVAIGDSVFVGTSKGLFSSKFDSRNLMDFSNWRKTKIDASSGNIAVLHFGLAGDQLCAALDGKGIYRKNATWQLQYRTKGNVSDLSAFGTKLFLFSDKKLGSILNSDTTAENVPTVNQVNEITLDQADNSILWLADGNEGLVKYNTSTKEISKYIPNGPLNNQIFNLKAIRDYVFHLSGAYDGVTTPLFKSANYSYFYQGEWYANKQAAEKGFQDLVSVALNDRNGKLYFASAWNGLVEKDGDNFKNYDQNSSTCPVIGLFGSRVTDTYYDINNDKLWFVNVAAALDAPSVHLFKDGNCIAYKFLTASPAGQYPVQVLADDAGNVWVRGNRSGGLFVFNDSKLNGSVPTYITLAKGPGVGNLGDNSVRSLAKDRNGDIWIGTNNGVSVVYSPASIVNFSRLDATTPIYENRPLLFDQAATCIAIDGGNRKWIGTNNGLYLFNAEANSVIHYFNTANSPLLSDLITSVAIEQQSGEVFIGSDKGIVSYREAATTGEDNSPSVLIFPNPVKTNYAGTIGFSGLATDAVVKITDISGRLLYEATANGGTAQWNGKDYNGKKIEPGVYVVLTSKSDGSGIATSKLFVLD